MPDEENPTATIEAEPDATTAEDEGTKLTDLVTEGATGTPAEQETQETESEQEQGDEAEPSFTELAEGLKESDPERYAELTKAFGGDDVAAERTAIEQEKAGLIAATQSQAAFAGVTQAYDPVREEAKTRMTGFGNAVAQSINKAVQESGGQPTTSGPRIAAALQDELGKAESTGRAIGLADSFLEACTAALMSSLGTQLTAEELTEIGGLTWQDAVSKPQETYSKFFDIVLKAAVRAAPAEVGRQREVKGQKEAEAAKTLGKLLASVGKNGTARAAVGAPTAKKAPTVAEYAAASSEQRQKWETDGVEPDLS